MSWRNGPWRLVARRTHLDAKAQRKLWRGLAVGWGAALLACWAVLLVLTRSAEKAGEEAGRMYVTITPMAAEVMDLRNSGGRLAVQPPLMAAERVARGAGVGPDRLTVRLSPEASTVPGGAVELHARALNLFELVNILRDLRVEGGLSTVSAQLTPVDGADNLMDLDMVLTR